MTDITTLDTKVREAKLKLMELRTKRAAAKLEAAASLAEVREAQYALENATKAHEASDQLAVILKDIEEAQAHATAARQEIAHREQDIARLEVEVADEYAAVKARVAAGAELKASVLAAPSTALAAARDRRTAALREKGKADLAASEAGDALAALEAELLMAAKGAA